MKRFRLLAATLAVAVLPSLQSCTARYQELLRNRDNTIDALEAEIADLSAENRTLRDQESEAQRRARDLQSKLVSAPAEATATGTTREFGEGATVRYSRGRWTLVIDDKVTFNSGSTKLKKGVESVLRKAAQLIKQEHSGQYIYVEGHTDSDPIRKSKDRFRSNRHLSAERADAVAAWLVNKGGVPAKQIVVVGFGPNDPASSSKDRNRRVQIVVGDPIDG